MAVAFQTDNNLTALLSARLGICQSLSHLLVQFLTRKCVQCLSGGDGFRRVNEAECLPEHACLLRIPLSDEDNFQPGVKARFHNGSCLFVIADRESDET